ncbi:DUF3575 domain-containing protein [bacterium]|nr:DUF3575 domain-containing protein [bacterium]
MKKLIILVLLSGLGFQSFAGVGDLGPRNIIKTNLISDAFLIINLNYELKISNSYSVGMIAGVMPERTYSLDASAFNNDGDDIAYSGEISPSGVFVSPYIRKYFKGAMTGFYMELFTKYYNYGFEIPYDYEKNNSTVMTAAVGKASAIGGGLSAGTQISLGKLFVLDFYAGLGLGYATARAETNDPQLDAQDYADIKEEMQGISDVEVSYGDFIISNLEYDATSDMAWIQSKTVVPMLKAGISFGIVF